MQEAQTPETTPITQLIDKYVQMALRRKWVIIFTFLPILTAGLAYCLFTPMIYRASTTLVVVPQKVPEEYVKSVISGSNEERIKAILQEITSRTNLEKVIKEFNLYPEMRKKYPMETVVEYMRDHISIELVGSKKRRRNEDTNTFIFSYEGKDPVTITNVVNAMANMFVEENLKLRTSQAETTATFLSSQLEKIYIELKQREEALKQYKIMHMGELPEQRESNIATLNALQQQLEGVKESIRRAQDRRLLLQQQYAQQKARLQARGAQTTTSGLDSGKDRPQNAAPASLAELEQELERLRTRYTENHPYIVALKQQIEQKKKEIAANGAKEQDGTDDTSSIDVTGDPILDNLSFQIKNVDMEIRQLKYEAETIQKKIALYQRRIENTPKREQELIDLTRDYDNLKATYQNLLQRKIEAEQAAALERKQQGEHFRIIDPARVPEKPVKPDMKKILPMIIVASLGLGIGLAFLQEMLSKTFYDPDDVATLLKLPVLICVPYLYTEKELQRRRRKERLYAALAFAGLCCVAAVGALLAIKGPGAYSHLLKGI